LFVARDVPVNAPTPPKRARNRAAGVRKDRERGDTLVEILLTIVVIGIVGSAAFYTISFGATNSKSHRDFVTADQLLRNSAEATKAAVRSACISGGNYSVAFSTLPAPAPAQPWHQYYETDRQFTLPADLTNTSCPTSSGATATPTVVLSVTLPDGTSRSLSIVVRRP
jgi:prepilin-type N-terminal cleavage/methylation domain-containing protein